MSNETTLGVHFLDANNMKDHSKPKNKLFDYKDIPDLVTDVKQEILNDKVSQCNAQPMEMQTIEKDFGLKMTEERKFYSEKERLLLCSLVNEYKSVIENKKTDAASLIKKKETWEKVTRLYNSNNVTKRSSKQLRKCWENMKVKTRKTDSQARKNFFLSGSGPSLKVLSDPVDEMVRSTVPTIDYTVKSQWDSTGIPQNLILDWKEGSVQEERSEMSSSSHSSFETEKITVVVTDEDSQAQSFNETFPARLAVLKKAEKESPVMSKYEHNFTDQDNGIGHEENTASLRTNSTTNINVKRKAVATPVVNTTDKRRKLDEEYQLILQKLKEGIEQQRELHEMRMAAVKAEKDYWTAKKLFEK